MLTRPLLAAALTAGLTAGLLGSPARAFDPSSMTEVERAAFGDAVRTYLMQNPQVIMEAVALLEAQKAEAEAGQDRVLVQTNAEALFNDGFSWQGGNLQGDVTLVEFLDYRCSYCRRAHDEVAELIRSDGQIRIIVKELPILGEQSVLASRFAIATRQVAGDEAYASVHDALMTLKSDVTETSLRRVAEALSLDADAILARMSDPEVTRQIAETRALAQRLGINGTPTFVVQDQMLRGYLPLDGMREVVAEVRGG